MLGRTLLAALLVSAVAAVPAVAQTRRCEDPGERWVRRPPAELGLDPERLQEALDWASTHTGASVAVYRHGCLARESRLDLATAQLPLDGWSMTKTVTALLVGRAVTLGLFDVDEPIGRLFPAADAEHAAITPRRLLTFTSGLRVNWGRDLAPQPDRVRDALSLPFDHQPGSAWQYHQSAVTLLAAAVERAVGEDLQAFAQRELFARVGIPRHFWSWERDRAGNTEGWAHLHMRGYGWARLGQLLLRGGTWRGARLIADDYMRAMTAPGAVNNAYGFLLWLNRGGSYVLPDVEGQDEGTGPLIASAPPDTLVMAGSGEQRVYAIPSRDMVIVRLGERGSREGDTRVSLWTGRGGEVDNEIVRRVLRAVTDVPYDDPGPYRGSELRLPPADTGVVGDATDVEEVLGGLGAGPRAPRGCSPAGCS